MNLPLGNRVSISGWGNYPTVSALVRRARHRLELQRLAHQRPPVLAAGRQRSYGDACLFSNVVSTVDLSHILTFDPITGVMRAEAGVTVEQIIRFALPQGWFPPVTPGTKFPTLGGCIAADVHGKNHHVDGSLGRFVEELEMFLADGTAIRCSRDAHGDLFHATIGGMGLTGIIYAAKLRLRPVSSAYLEVRSERVGCLAEALHQLAATQDDYTYSVAWIDCLARGRARGRSILMLANHAEVAKLPVRAERWRPHPEQRLALPTRAPEFLLNKYSMRLFNSLYYHRRLRRTRLELQHYDPYFYPLDRVGHWNRIYGRSGFLQYQFVVPRSSGEAALDEVLERTSRRGSGSFLAVLKTFGEAWGMLSFPQPGYTLALDFPRSDPTIHAFLRDLTGVVQRAGGRVYLAKDALLDKETFSAMYPELEQFLSVKRRYDPNNHFRSAQSQRLGLQ